MNLLKLTISCLLIFILSYGVSNAQETTLFVAAAETCDSSEPDVGVLYRVNPLNGDSMEVGPIEIDGEGVRGVTGLAFLGDGRLVGSANADFDNVKVAILIEIDPLTGESVEIGEIGDNGTAGECGRAPDLTYDPATDTLFTMGFQCMGFGGNGVLMRINQTTGQGTQMGDTGVNSGAGNGLAIRDDGTLFWATNVVGPDPTTLFTINPATGQATEVTAVSEQFVRLNALAFHPVTGVLFASTGNLPQPFDNLNVLLQTVNTTTGLLTTIGQLPDCSDALIFSPPVTRNVPALSQWGLIAMAGILGIVGFMVMRRRKALA